MLKDLLIDGESRERCHVSRKMIDIGLILKQSGVRAFKLEEIKNLIGADKIEEALNLLRGAFKEDTDIVKLLQRLNGLYRQFSIDGTLALEDYRLEKNRITEGVMKVLKGLLS